MDLEEIKKQAAEISERYRKGNKLTQTELANLAGVSKRSIYNIEHEVTVYGETLQKVFDACGWEYGTELRHFLKKK